MRQAQPRLDERLEPHALVRCTELLERSAHQAQVHAAHDALAVSRELAEGAGVQPDRLAGVRRRFGGEAGVVEQSDQLRDRVGTGVRRGTRQRAAPPLPGAARRVVRIGTSGELVRQDGGQRAIRRGIVIGGLGGEVVSDRRPTSAAGPGDIGEDEAGGDELLEVLPRGVGMEIDRIGQVADAHRLR